MSINNDLAQIDSLEDRGPRPKWTQHLTTVVSAVFSCPQLSHPLRR